MATFSCRPILCPLRYCGDQSHKHKNRNRITPGLVDNKMNGLRACVGIHENGYISEEMIGQKIPIPGQKQLVDPYRQGLIIERGVGYRQTVVIRSYEVGPEKTATLESLLNLLQETALNHVWMSGLLSKGFGATHGMMSNNLIWVVSRMHLQLHHYPIWGEVVEMDTWVGASGKNGMRRDWLIRSQATGITYATATRSDLDMNHHVNNVKYVRWMLETIPDNFLESHQLSSIILEYRRESGSSDIVESLCQPDEDGAAAFANGFAVQHKTVDLSPGNGYTHLLHVKGETRNEEIVRGRTRWKQKLSTMPYSFINKL
ncbi:Acyl-ACP thioesterase [Corchorus capsularis]|uniref:Acyl-[acyl-carrier-protein] hydrolase n=1 Tax=Corchorus capsularis TaxID=210143 RepID=A0A1R3GN33_COCAP|nr:Acyl-ACP thioesterase [Corchorus capsularis]